MRHFLRFGVLAVIGASVSARAQLPALVDGSTIRLWASAAPGALGTDSTDVPTLTVYLPRYMTANTPAVIICPGGAYVRLSMNQEGRQVANYLNSLGMAAFVLRYRLGPKYHHPAELGDAQRAIRLVRANAAAWKLDTARVGILGFSAGGHLAMSASNRFTSGDPKAMDPLDRVSSRPDFVVLGYPVISMSATWTHAGSRTNLLGDPYDASLADSLSGEKMVTNATPPTFILQTTEDKTVPAENSVEYYLALKRAGVPVEMHVFERGPHGVGLGNGDMALTQWPILLSNWFRVHGIIK